MKTVANVAIHASQFPESVRRDLLASLRTRQVNHKFHYDSVKQTQKWLALHQIYSPSRNDADCAATYDRAFCEAAEEIKAKRVHVMGLGCGGGQKDTRLLKLLKVGGREVFYTPGDVSTAMVLVARAAAMAVVPEKICFPLVCGLASAPDLPAVFDSCPAFSANLAPGENYPGGVKKILPQYDNPPTRDWLLTFLLDLGVQRGDGELRFAIEPGGLGLKRVVALFHFTRARRVEIESETFPFRRGESIRLFFSYRYTPALARKALASHGLKVLAQWITQSEEEGVFLCRRK